MQGMNSVELTDNCFFHSIQRQRKMQKERLMSDFSSALNNFQAAQRQAAEKERASVARARASSGYNVSILVL